MESIFDLLKEPFSLGLILGLAVALALAISAWNRRRTLDREIRSLREHLHMQMSISAKGSQVVTEENEQLKKQNENLRVSLAALKNKPDRSELRTLYLYDKAIHLMYAKAPGFAPVWESSMREAEVEMERTGSGALAWVRKIVRPSLAAGYSDSLLPQSSSPDSAEEQGGKTGSSN